jgi:hypothetical protein
VIVFLYLVCIFLSFLKISILYETFLVLKQDKSSAKSSDEQNKVELLCGVLVYTLDLIQWSGLSKRQYGVRMIGMDKHEFWSQAALNWSLTSEFPNLRST